jgi:hypothetical protein
MKSVKWLLFVMLGPLAACGTLRPEVPATGGAPPSISERELSRHLQRIHRASVSEADRGVRQDELAMYVGARLREFGFRPVFGESYRMRYFDSAARPRQVRIAIGSGMQPAPWEGPGTVTAHNRSGPVSAVVESIVSGRPSDRLVPANAAVVLEADDLSPVDVLEWADIGVEAIIIVGGRTTSIRRFDFPRTAVIFASNSAAEQMLAHSRSDLNALMRADSPGPVSLPGRLLLEVHTTIPLISYRAKMSLVY